MKPSIKGKAEGMEANFNSLLRLLVAHYVSLY
jgi:hypothetical protein